MGFSDIAVFLTNFNEDIKELEKRYNHDSNNNILQSYIAMASRIKKQANIFLNPAIKELELLRMRYGERYQLKDLDFHVQQALDNMAYIKHLLKEILELYAEQEPYVKISERWKACFPSIDKRLKEINSRLILVERILKDEF